MTDAEREGLMLRVEIARRVVVDSMRHHHGRCPPFAVATGADVWQDSLLPLTGTRAQYLGRLRGLVAKQQSAAILLVLEAHVADSPAVGRATMPADVAPPEALADLEWRHEVAVLVQLRSGDSYQTTAPVIGDGDGARLGEWSEIDWSAPKLLNGPTEDIFNDPLPTARA